jgi:type IV pilus assembly protein PilO
MALNTEFIVKMPIGQKLLVLVALILLIGILYWLMIASKLKEEYEQKENSLNDKRTELAKLETVEKDKEKLDRELKEKERKLEKAKEKLPTETEMENLFLTISDLGKQNGISFEIFKPLPERKQGDLYWEVPIELKYKGNYRYVMNFFYKVTHLSRIVNFGGVGITGAKGGSDINVNCTATTYKFAGK